MTDRCIINVYPGRAERMRCYQLNVILTTGEPTESKWHSAPLTVPAEGEYNGNLGAGGCRIINAALRCLGESYEVYISQDWVYLVRDKKGRWDDVDTLMLKVIKNALWRNRAVEMYLNKEPRP